MISLKNVSKWYGHFQVLTDCSTEVKKGDVVVVCGPSGSGKSTLIKTVNGLEPVQQGEIVVNGTQVNNKKTNLAELRSHVGMVFQHFNLFPHMTVLDNITFAPIEHKLLDKTEAEKVGMELLEKVGLSDKRDAKPESLSGGQKQKIFIARAILANEDILILDEPSTGVDSKSMKEIYGLIASLNKKNGVTVISVEHNLETALQNSSHILTMENGFGTLYTSEEYIRRISNVSI